MQLCSITKGQQAIRQLALALELQRPLPDDALMIVPRGERKDEAGEIAA